MERFAALVDALVYTRSRNEKLRLIAEYLRETPDPDRGWALALPDPEEPVTHIWAEGDSDGDARRLAQEYARRIRQLLR